MQQKQHSWDAEMFIAGKQHRDRHAEVSLSDNFVVIAFHALWHVGCTNLAFSEYSKEE